MEIIELGLPGVKLIRPKVFEDYRGYYMESYSARTLRDKGINIDFVQDNHLLCLKANTIRGIHFQNQPKAQTKLLRCTKGSILDVVVDLRKGSPTYKEHISIILTADSREQILIPKGFGHACMSLEDGTEVQYKVDEFYEPEYDRAITWKDPELNINWGVEKPIVSEKDGCAPTLQESDANFVMELNE